MTKPTRILLVISLQRCKLLHALQACWGVVQTCNDATMRPIKTAGLDSQRREYATFILRLHPTGAVTGTVPAASCCDLN